MIKLSKLSKRAFTHFDILLPLLVLPLVGTSFYLINASNETLGDKQIIYFFLGVICFLFFFLIPIRRLEWLFPIFYFSNILLLVCVEFFGVTKLGAQRWLEIPFVHFTLQPSEFMKPALLLMLVYHIKQNPPPEDGYGIRDFLQLSFYILLPFGLIIKEPDLGTGLVLLIVGYGVLFIIGVRRKIWLTILAGILVTGPFLYGSLHDYQKKRISDFISEEPSYHVEQSIIAIGSGGMHGKPKEEATQSNFKFLPISTSDFIFSYYVERFGFVGAVILISLYGLLILHILSLFYSFSGDYFGKVFSIGLSLFIFVYMGVNISMTIGFAPVVGVPLPFFSYGGSSFIIFMIMFGVLENLVTFRNDHSYSAYRR